MNTRVLLGCPNRISKDVYIADVISVDSVGTWVKYPRNPEAVYIEHEVFTKRFRRWIAVK